MPMLEKVLAALGALAGSLARFFPRCASGALALVYGLRGALLALAVFAGIGYALYRHPPMKPIGRGELGVRTSRFSGEVTEWREGGVLVLPGVHELRVFSLR